MDKKKVKELSDLVRKYVDFDSYHIFFDDLRKLGLEDIMKDLDFPEGLIEDFWNDLSEESTFFRDSLIAINILNMSTLSDFEKIYYITKNFYASEELREWIIENDLEPKERVYIEWEKRELKGGSSIFNFFKKK